MSEQWGPPPGPPPAPGTPHGDWLVPPQTPPYSHPIGQPPYGASPGGGWEPPPAVYPQQHHPLPPQSAQAPGGLKALVIILSVLKAIPLVLLLLLVFLFGSLSGGFSDVEGLDEVDGALGGAFAIFAVVILVFVAIGAVLLFFHIRSAVASKLTALAVVAGIMTLIDLLFFVGTASGDVVDAGSVVFMGAILAAQGAVLAWALMSRSGQVA